MSTRQNGLGLNASSLDWINQKEMKWHPYQICVRWSLIERDCQRRLNLSNWFIRLCQNNKFLPNIVIGNETWLSMDGTVNKYNVWMKSPKSDKPDFTFQRNSLRQKFTVWGGTSNNSILSGPYFFEGNVNGGNYLEILNNLILLQLKLVCSNVYGGWKMKLQCINSWQ